MFKSFHLPYSLSTLRERARVRGAVNFFSLHQPSPPAGEGRVRGHPFNSSLPLRERTKVRASVCLLTFKNKFFIIPLEEVQTEVSP
jgi:hypothetical protein